MDTKRDILRCFIKVHVLFHASHRPVYGLGLIEELARHGYQLSPGTLYPLLHSMKQEGYLASHEAVVGGKVRRYYRATALGEEALQEAQAKIKELVSAGLERPGASYILLGTWPWAFMPRHSRGAGGLDRGISLITVN